MGLRNFITKRSYVNMDYVYGTLCRSDGENPLDYPALRDNPMELYVVATNAFTGEPKYFDKACIRQDDYSVMKASSAIPFLCRPQAVGGELYFDGALGDPVPLDKAFRLGCERVVVILTKPESEQRNSEKDEKLAAHIRKKYPVAAEKLCQRARRYNENVAQAKEYAGQGKVLLVSPDDTCGVDTLKRNKASLRRLYAKGYASGQKIADFLSESR